MAWCCGRRGRGPLEGNDIPVAVAVSPDGSAVFVTGESQDETGEDDIMTLAYDASSSVVTQATSPAPSSKQ